MIIDYPSTKISRKIAKKFGYHEFIIRRWINFFDDYLELIKAMEKGIPKYIRVNTLRIKEKNLIERLKDKGFELESTEIPFCYKVLREPFSIGATPEYLMGYYYVMEKNSCIPPLALDPKPGEIVADFAASPGGKTTFISQLMQNKGVVLAIEISEERIQALIDNIHRLGCMNIAVINMDASEFWKTGVKVDKILLDAPCSGEGVIHKDPSRKTRSGKRDIEICAEMQRKLIKSAIKSLKVGGVLVYSTCSLTPEENEFIINEVLECYPLEIEEIEWGENAFTEIPKKNIKFKSELRKAKRFYPHKHETSGFFVAKLKLKKEV